MARLETQKARPQSAYSEKLKDPRWQKMRLEILQRDDWACQHCGDSETTLHVHHRFYERGKEPWEYDTASLMTLCAPCHEAETELMQIETKELGELLKRVFSAIEIRDIKAGFSHLVSNGWLGQPCVVASALEWKFGDPSFWDQLATEYIADLAEKKRERACGYGK